MLSESQGLAAVMQNDYEILESKGAKYGFDPTNPNKDDVSGLAGGHLPPGGQQPTSSSAPEPALTGGAGRASDDNRGSSSSFPSRSSTRTRGQAAVAAASLAAASPSIVESQPFLQLVSPEASAGCGATRNQLKTATDDGNRRRRTMTPTKETDDD